MTINQSLSYGIRVLLLFDVQRPLLTVSEISEQLEYSKSKTYRLVRTLAQHGLLEEDGGSSKYGRGLNVLRLGFVAQQRFDICKIARPFMEELCARTNETVFLTALCGTKAICLERVESEDPIRWTAFRPCPISVCRRIRRPVEQGTLRRHRQSDQASVAAMAARKPDPNAHRHLCSSHGRETQRQAVGRSVGHL